MKTDPNIACGNTQENWFWAVVHDLFAHPLMAISGWSGWSLEIHNFTSNKAWPVRQMDPPPESDTKSSV